MSFDGPLFINQASDLVHEHDLIFRRWESLRSGRARFTRAGKRDDDIETVGTPDLVIEVMGDSSVNKGKVRPRKALCVAGISECRLVDARGKPAIPQIRIRGRRENAAVVVDREGCRRSAAPQYVFLPRRKTNIIAGSGYELPRR